MKGDHWSPKWPPKSKPNGHRHGDETGHVWCYRLYRIQRWSKTATQSRSLRKTGRCDQIDYWHWFYTDEQTERCFKVIREHRHHIEGLTDNLMTHKSLDLNQIIQILGERPFEMKQEFKDFLQTKREINMESNFMGSKDLGMMSRNGDSNWFFVYVYK